MGTNLWLSTAVTGGRDLVKVINSTAWLVGQRIKDKEFEILQEFHKLFLPNASKLKSKLLS